MKTIGLLPSCSAVWLISRTTWCALSGVSMNGRRTWRGLTANCARIELPKVSAVMPVPSETKNTVRLGMRRCARGGARGRDRSLPMIGSAARRIALVESPASRPRACSPPLATAATPIAFAASLPRPATVGRARRAAARVGRHRFFTSHGAFPCHPPTWRPPWSSRFEHLRMTDVEAVGGKNASLGEMISQLAASGVRVPGGFATTAHAFREFLAARRPGASASTTGSPTLDTDDVRALAEAGAEIRALDRGDSRCPPALEAAVRARVRAAQPPTHPTRPSRCARRPPPKTCPTRRSPASRRPSSTSSASTTCSHRMKRGLRQPLQRPRDQLPRAQGLRARRRGAVGRRAAHGALATSARPA